MKLGVLTKFPEVYYVCYLIIGIILPLRTEEMSLNFAFTFHCHISILWSEPSVLTGFSFSVVPIDAIKIRNEKQRLNSWEFFY